MARITVEDCIDKFESRFELVLVASNRARKLHSGESPTVEKDNDKPTVIALREIADESLSIDSLKEKLINSYQTVSSLDEEELSLDYAGSESEVKDDLTEVKDDLTEVKDDLTEVDEMLNEVTDEANNLNKDETNEDGDDSLITPKNDEYADISEDNNTEN